MEHFQLQGCSSGKLAGDGEGLCNKWLTKLLLTEISTQPSEYRKIIHKFTCFVQNWAVNMSGCAFRNSKVPFGMALAPDTKILHFELWESLTVIYGFGSYLSVFLFVFFSTLSVFAFHHVVTISYKTVEPDLRANKEKFHRKKNVSLLYRARARILFFALLKDAEEPQ